MSHCTAKKEPESLRLITHGDVVTFSKPSANVVNASLESGNYKVVCECTRFQISFHFDELTETYFIVFGHGVTLSTFNFTQIQTLSKFLGFRTHPTLEEA